MRFFPGGYLMSRRKRRRGKADAPLGPIAAWERAVALDEQQSRLRVITPEQAAKGTYQGHGRRYVNRGGTPVARWVAAGRISDAQALAIQLCLRLWAVAGVSQRTTATYGERLPPGGHMSEAQALREIEARKDLRRIEGYVPARYWEVFENVCRFDEPAGIAGSRLGECDKAAEVAARTIVCFVADVIAMKERLLPTTRIRVA